MTTFESARPTTGLDLASVPNALLAAVVTYFSQNGVQLPERQYVTAGDPNLVAWDCAQLVVCLADLGWGRATDATQLSPTFGKAASVNAMRHATYAVLLLRDVPHIEDGPELPGVDELAASGEVTMRDAGLLSQCLVNFVAFRNEALPPGGSVQAGQVQMIGPAGGLVGISGGLMVTAGTLTTPPDEVPAGLVIRNGSGQVSG